MYRNAKVVHVQRKVGNSCCIGYVKTKKNANKICQRHHAKLQSNMIFWFLMFDLNQSTLILRVPAPEGNSISGPFMPEELAAVLKHLEPKTSTSGFYFPGVYTPWQVSSQILVM